MQFPKKIIKEVKASRECPKCFSKRIRKNGLRVTKPIRKKIAFLEKHLSSGIGFTLQGISTASENRLKVWTTGDISTCSLK